MCHRRTVVVGCHGPVQCAQLERYRWRIIVDRGQSLGNTSKTRGGVREVTAYSNNLRSTSENPCESEAGEAKIVS